ncbi:hypothetical protein GCM10022226_78570 [Sphaerisporangium flaviroseum]|uniref:Transglycosylase SLT domain-containing protein n=1 Tax=Sphaerisporangium flaviroseum TaxID=509199 RepID=A0ABP7JFH1_9ACTN
MTVAIPLAAGSAPARTSPGSDLPARITGIPGAYLRLYATAARSCPGLSWNVLAAIGKVESDHGRNNGLSSAGALGPMQFLPATFAAYAVDGDSDGDTDINDPADAIATAAHYLCVSGASRDVRTALFAYNHSWAYVITVLKLADGYAARAATAPPGDTALPSEQPDGADHLTPRMRRLREVIRRLFGAPHGIGCYRPNGGITGGGEHPLGRACDVMLSTGARLPTPGEQARGDAIAAWVQVHARQYGVMYIIWRQRIWNPARAGEGWRPMTDRGGITEDHFDHVHISVL